MVAVVRRAGVVTTGCVGGGDVFELPDLPTR